MAERPIRAVVVDDEPLARSIVRRLLEEQTGISVVGEAGSGAAAVELIQRQAPELVFLDVQMPGMTGFEVIDRIGVERMPGVIFVTAYDEHALRAFEVHAIDYLLKPVSRQRFRAALERAIEGLRTRELSALIGERLAALMGSARASGERLERLAVRRGEGVSLVPVAEIEWIEACGKQARVHRDRDSDSTRESLKEIEKKLDPRRFLRVHRSAIVNLDRVAAIHPWFKGTFVLVLTSGARVVTGATYRDRVDALYHNRPATPP